MALIEKLTAIADAIRSKTGKTDGLTLDQMPGEIAGIQTGGDTSQEDGLVERTLTSYSNDRVTTVGTDAFANYSRLTHVSLPNVTILGASAFKNSGLRTFFFPKLTAMNGLARTQIESITTEDLPALESWGGDYCCAYNSKLKYFQHTLTVIMNKRNFQNCTALEKADTHTVGITLNAFNGCTSLNTLILRRTDAVCELGNTGAINNTPILKGTGFVYVPRALLEEYRQATNWSSLLPEQFRAIEDYPEICEVSA